MKKTLLLLAPVMLFLAASAQISITGTRISQLPPMLGPALQSDLLPLVDSGQTKQVTVLQLLRADTAYHTGATGPTGAQGRSGSVGATGATGSVASPVVNIIEFADTAKFDSPVVFKKVTAPVAPILGGLVLDTNKIMRLYCNACDSLPQYAKTSQSPTLYRGIRTGVSVTDTALSITTAATDTVYKVSQILYVSVYDSGTLKPELIYTDAFSDSVNTLQFYKQGATSNITNTGVYAFPAMVIRAKANTKIYVLLLLLPGTAATYSHEGIVELF